MVVWPFTSEKGSIQFGKRILASLTERQRAFGIDEIIVVPPVGAVVAVAFALDALMFALLAAVGLTLLYDTAFTAVRGQTPGKRLIGIEVIRMGDGRRPGWGRALIRSTIKLLSLVPPFSVVQAVAVLSPRNMAVHDRLSDTIVVRIR